MTDGIDFIEKFLLTVGVLGNMHIENLLQMNSVHMGEIIFQTATCNSCIGSIHHIHVNLVYFSGIANSTSIEGLIEAIMG